MHNIKRATTLRQFSHRRLCFPTSSDDHINR